MKRQLLPLSLLLICVANTSLADEDADTPDVYLNKNIGFNVEGYKYTQSEYPCEVDKVLVEKLVERAASSNLDIEATGAAEKIRNGQIPVLAIDIEGLVLDEEHAFGTRSHSNLPSVRVMAALVNNKAPEGFTTAKHSCAIATLSELTPSSNVLDLGTYGTVCSVTHDCLGDLSKDIIEWVKPQIR